jgi:histidine triad (HIT) family protein
MEDSIFTKIIKGEIPCHKVYEDDTTLAFLDIYGTVKGHTLVIPKAQVEFVWDLDQENYQALMATTKKVALRLRETLGTTYVGEKVMGTDVPHAHVHLIPFSDTNVFKTSHLQVAEPDHEELARIAQRLHFT